MFYRVTENFYEDPDNVHEYDTLPEAKEHVDLFYKNSEDTYDTCSIVQVSHEKDIDYVSPWENLEFRRLMKMNKDDLVLKLLEKSK